MIATIRPSPRWSAARISISSATTSPLATASRNISRNRWSSHYFRQQEQHNRFVTRDDRPELHQLLDRFIHAIDSDTAMRIMQNWLNRGDLSFLNTPLPFTAEEQRWLQKHRRIRLLVNPYFPPLPWWMTKMNCAASWPIC
jgi:two-component system sensor histidine kinase EvgS